MELDPAILHILVRRRRLLSRKIVELNAILEVTPLLLDEDDNSDNNEPVHGGFNELLSRWLPIAPQAGLPKLEPHFAPPVEGLNCVWGTKSGLVPRFSPPGGDALSDQK
ncbi:hypothetical protein PGTUg99_005089 [Puccinia graminis f. sp. tritici]|uniref:Uncharacterized protein n=1 Tax=Puccinia graminis f. sp. tritici TaxID=56615 RepID=A0A5B0LH04_PUCGR|nr:hypothetical protein PGTUg99_005089 [Puccinia graminis f. sp. tritici]